MSYLRELVHQKIRSFPSMGEAANFFDVSETLVRQWDTGSKPIPLIAVERVFDVESLPGAAEAQEARWEGKQVAFLLPAYKASNPRTQFAITAMFDRQKHAAMSMFGDAFIAHTRNQLADNFLKSKLEWALTIDDDMIVPFGNAQLFRNYTHWNLPDSFAGLNTVNRLLSHGKTLVGGLYFGRHAASKPVYCEGHNDPIEEAYARKAPYDLIKPTRWIGTGCLLIHRSVFLDIENRFPHLARNKEGNFGHWFTSSEHDLRAAATETLRVLNDGSADPAARLEKARELMAKGEALSRQHSPLAVGEDVIFCNRAAQAGHIAHVDMGLLCGHVGEFCYGPRKPG